PGDNDAFKDLLDKIETVTGGVTVADKIKLEVALTARDAAAAREIDKALTESLSQALGFLMTAANTQKQLAPLVDVLKSIKTSTRDKMVLIKAELGAEFVEKALPKE